MTIVTKNSLHNQICNAILSPVPLSKEQPCRWIKHPLAVRITTDNLMYHILPYQRNSLIHAFLRCIWGHGSGAKENAPTVSSVVRHCFAATRSTINIKLFMETTTMIYTFLVATRNQTLAQLNRIRTVSTVANTEAQARAQLNGLPLVFIRCSAAKAGV
ncbi:hypothetical protein J8L98_23150 [Pseudoalteromonas sp. MMG013]|uniref:hypothetical protein n=1 Tax=Pseudoalteromonas sp. MMG013 TaxID=2822687 RepID=UPI001B3597BD|nr:hypothetical protein [Pseudoalteromonas sp. MMG013]MBQ4864584.1 hypothetical protein [Pseudoalteromonas sp. MMG013]